MGDTLADEPAATLAADTSPTADSADPASGFTSPAPPAAPDPDSAGPAPPAAPDPDAGQSGPADPAAAPAGQPTGATTTPVDGAPAGGDGGTITSATNQQKQPPATAPPSATKKQTAPATAPPATTKKQTAPAKAPAASNTKDSPAAGTAGAAPDKDPNASGTVASAPAAGDRPATAGQELPADPPPVPPPAEGAIARIPPAPATAGSTPPVVSTPAIVAHRSDRIAATQAAPSSAEPVVVEQDHASVRLTAAPGAAHPLILGAPAWETPALAPPQLPPAPSASPTEVDAGAHARVHRRKPARASPPAPDQAPVAPSAPIKHGPVSVAASAAGSSGGPSTAMWCAVIFGFLLYAVRDLRPHRGRLLLAAPAGVPSPQQRPG